MRPLFLLCCLFACLANRSWAQNPVYTVKGRVQNPASQPLPQVTVQLLRSADSVLVKMGAADAGGQFVLEGVKPGSYLLLLQNTGYRNQYHAFELRQDLQLPPLVMEQAVASLDGVTVVSRRPLVEFRAGRTIVNVEGSVTNVGATALEVLEKSPGVTVDKDGNISLKGRQQVLVLIDGKPTYQSPADLATMLAAMPASQLESLEIMTNPPARYDAAGSTGIIAIKTKKNRAAGFNGSLGLNLGQGSYPKSNNSLMLNYRGAKINTFLNYSLNAQRQYTDLYAIRKYYATDDQTLLSSFEQFSFLRPTVFSHNLRTGIDFYFNAKTSLSLAFTGLYSDRKQYSNSPGVWRNAAGNHDSSIVTGSNNTSLYRHGGATVAYRRSFSGGRELSADADYLRYDLGNDQYFSNTVTGSSNYTDAVRGVLPSDIEVLSARADYVHPFGKALRAEMGWKSARVATDNLADYSRQQNGAWSPDLEKSNHFLYNEQIHAAYVNGTGKWKRWEWQAGLRYEFTSYNAHQLGNALQKDSAFSRRYHSLFPTLYLTYQADSLNAFTLQAGRRIDRPAFQKLNPFVFLINKYTYQRGNPLIVPQYTWNVELSHQYNNWLVTSLSYGYTRNYFSQIFLTQQNVMIYTEGNLGSLSVVGASVSARLEPARWWALTLAGNLSHRVISGFVWNEMKASLTQVQLNLNNQFRFGKGWSAELSGFYNGREQELQEVTVPSGQLSAGVTKQVMKNKGSLRLTVRDVFYTQWMKGHTTFLHATEYFELTRDTRVVFLGFTYRFGKTTRDSGRRRSAAADEINRVGV